MSLLVKSEFNAGRLILRSGGSRVSKDEAAPETTVRTAPRLAAPNML